jgi:hypothetical protein
MGLASQLQEAIAGNLTSGAIKLLRKIELAGAKPVRLSGSEVGPFKRLRVGGFVTAELDVLPAHHVMHGPKTDPHSKRSKMPEAKKWAKIRITDKGRGFLQELDAGSSS